MERVAVLAVKRGLPRSQIALAWVFHNDVVTSPIIGATKVSHLDEAIAALDVNLSAEEITFLEEAYVPHAVMRFQQVP